jgi:hypothetical protein
MSAIVSTEQIGRLQLITRGSARQGVSWSAYLSPQSRSFINHDDTGGRRSLVVWQLPDPGRNSRRRRKVRLLGITFLFEGLTKP